MRTTTCIIYFNLQGITTIHVNIKDMDMHAFKMTLDAFHAILTDTCPCSRVPLSDMSCVSMIFSILSHMVASYARMTIMYVDDSTIHILIDSINTRIILKGGACSGAVIRFCIDSNTRDMCPLQAPESIYMCVAAIMCSLDSREK